MSASRASTSPTTEPAAVHVVESPEQLKAFTDPLRNKILAALAERACTNQQLAERLGEPQAKVLYHVRVLVSLGLVRLVDSRVKGGNVEKYYRAVARLFSLRPGPEQFPALIDAGLETIRQDVAASAALWPDQRRWFEGRSRRISPDRLERFTERVRALLREYWDEAEDDPSAPLMGFVALTYRDPADHGDERSD